MNYAIVEASGKQFWIEPGKFYDLNYIDLNPGDKIALVRVLLVNNNGNVSVGYPTLTFPLLLTRSTLTKAILSPGFKSI